MKNSTKRWATITILSLIILLPVTVTWADEEKSPAKNVSDYLASFSAEGVELPNISAYVRKVGVESGLPTLRQVLEFLWKLYQADPPIGIQGARILDDIYGFRLRQKVDDMAGYILDAAEQLIQQGSMTLSSEKARDSFSKAAILVEACGNYLFGNGVDLRVIKGGEEDNQQMEISIATINTSRGPVKIYLMHEKDTSGDQAVTVSRSVYISLDNAIIIQKETEKSLQPNQQQKQLLIGENIGIGAILSLKKTNTQKQIEKTEYDVKVIEYGFDRGFIRLVLSSDSSEQGRLIIMDVDKSIQREYFPRDVSVRVNGEPAKLANSVSDVLSGEMDKPVYFLALTGSGLQIVLYIPSWSTKVVLIGSSSSLSYLISIPSIIGRETEFTATTLAAAILVMALAANRLKRTK